MIGESLFMIQSFRKTFLEDSQDNGLKKLKDDNVEPSMSEWRKTEVQQVSLLFLRHF